jgi:hypothetical protein
MKEEKTEAENHREMAMWQYLTLLSTIYVLIVISYYQQKPANSMAATVSKAIIK